MSPAEVMTPSLKVMQARKKEKKNEVFVAKRCEDLEGLDKKKKRKRPKSIAVDTEKKMTKTYCRMTKEMVFVEG